MAKLEIKLPKFEKKEDEKKDVLGQVFTDLDGLEAYTRVLEMDKDLGEDRSIKGIHAQLKAIREKLENL